MQKGFYCWFLKNREVSEGVCASYGKWPSTYLSHSLVSQPKQSLYADRPILGSGCSERKKVSDLDDVQRTLLNVVSFLISSFNLSSSGNKVQIHNFSAVVN